MTQITEKEFETFKKGRDVQEKFENHITEVLKEIIKLYGGKYKTWYYPGAGADGNGGMGESVEFMMTIFQL